MGAKMELIYVLDIELSLTGTVLKSRLKLVFCTYTYSCTCEVYVFGLQARTFEP